MNEQISIPAEKQSAKIEFNIPEEVMESFAHNIFPVILDFYEKHPEERIRAMHGKE